MDVVLLLAGLALLLGGGDLLVRGAAGIARGLGVSPLAIGLTVVAFGTSAPELAVNLIAALQGSAGLSFGNVVGSNIANLGLILGLTACVRPLDIQGSVILREIPLMILATVATLVMALDPALRGQTAALDRTDGILLLLLFGLFLYAVVLDVLRQRRDPLLKEAAELPVARSRRKILADALMVLGGLFGLAFGGDLLVGAATNIARTLGMSDAVIGLTIVAVGTSLPELATSALAARRKETDIAVGNLVGSNIFNLLFVLATTCTIAPLELPGSGALDLGAALGISLLLLPMAITGRRVLSRAEGAVLLALWVAFTSWRALGDP